MDEIKNLNISKTFQMAIQSHKDGNIIKAKSLYIKVLELDPNHENANINIGVIFQQLGEFQNAKKCYEHVLKNNSKNIKAYINLGVVFKNLGKIEEAKKYFEKAIETAKLREQQVLDDNILGPLHGIPVGIKDIIHAEGFKTEFNCKAFRDTEVSVAILTTALDEVNSEVVIEPFSGPNK